MKMNGSVVDANVIIKMLHNEKAALEMLAKIDEAFIPVVVAGELFYGAYKSSNPEKNMALFQNVLAQFEVLPIGLEIANSYALIKAELKKTGKPIPENDLWIAATAHAYNLPLATFDAHFANVPQITLV
jgi:tRNA(fMet)-specific endonuclease VapC